MNKGFSLLEVILASAIFMLFSTSAVVVVLGGINTNRLGAEETIASQFAAEGIEAAKSIKNQSYSNLTSLSFADRGIIRNVSDVWEFLGDGTNNVLVSGKNYTRTIKVENVNRDVSGNIVATGGILDPDTKKITSTVSWNFNSARPESVVLTSYLSDWRKPISVGKNGLLAYGDGGTSSDAIRYKIFDGAAGTWGAAASTADVDSASSNRALRVARVFASPTRNEKILVSKHFNGSTQYIYAQVFDGSTWGNVILLSSFSSTSFTNVRNFDGAYLTNGNFMVVYSDNSSIPKYNIWNGNSWGSQTNTVNVGGIPNYIVTRVRPATNEVMMAVFDQTSDTNTSYFNGSTWSGAIEHATAAPTNTKEHIDFTWSLQNSLKGALVYASSGSDNRQNLKIWTANGSGGGSFSGSVDASNLGGRLGAVDVDSRRGAEEFVSCQKNANNKIGCFRADTTLSWSTPANNTLVNNTEGGIQRSYNFAYEDSGNEGIVVYSDNTSTPKLRKYVSSSNSFDSSVTSLDVLGGILTTVRARPLQGSDDIFVFMTAGGNLYSQLWDGTSNVMYTSPSGKNFSTHGTNGSSAVDFWYDFAWDRF